jgi:hypothetical protein
MKFPSLFLFSLVFFFASCENVTDTQTDQVHLYADIPALVTSLQTELKNANPSVQKTVRVDGKSEKITAKDIDWEKELTLFQELNLNKSAFKGQFTEQKAQNGSVKYMAKEKDMLIQVLEMKLDTKTQKPIQISAFWENRNILYETSRNLSMELVDGKLRKYTVDTKQKLKFGKMQMLGVEGVILQ